MLVVENERRFIYTARRCHFFLVVQFVEKRLQAIYLLIVGQIWGVKCGCGWDLILEVGYT